MFELTPSQSKILEAFFDIQRENQDLEKGITSYTLRNQGIPGRTFDINRNVLLYHQLIRIIEEVKTGKQTRTYYEITPVGFFTMIKSVSTKKPKVLEKYVKFIPYLGERWNKYSQILKSYQFLLPRLLGRAIDEIYISPQYRLHSKDYKFRPRIEEVSKFIFEDRGMEVKLADLYYPADEEEKGIHPKTFLKKKEKIWKKLFSKESIKISDHMIKQMIFLFYFNTIKLKFDDRFGFHIFNDFHVSEFEKIDSEIPKEHVEVEDFEKEKQRYKKLWEDYDKFWQTARVKFCDAVLKDIFEREDLFFVFVGGYEKLLAAFKQRPRTFNEIDRLVTAKMIQKGIEYGIIKEAKTKDSDSESKS